MVEEKFEMSQSEVKEWLAELTHEQDFLTKYGDEFVCITSWLAEPRFTVNELVAAIETKIRSSK